MRTQKLSFMILALIIAVALTGCGAKTGNEKNPAANADPTASAAPAEETLSGSILAVGSTALQPLVEQVSKKFMEDKKYAGITVQVQGGGSGTGLTQVSGKQADIGNSDIFAEEKFKDADAGIAKELVDHQVAVVAMASVVNPDVAVESLTKAQLVDIFTGKVTNWKEVGGNDLKIVIINRPSSSGTRKTYEVYALGTKAVDIKGSIQEESSGTVKKLVAETPGAIGYLALSYLDDKVKSLKYDGVEATVENVKTGQYPVWAYEHMYTNGEPNEVVKAFLDYMASDAVQQGDVTELGYIPASEMTITRDVNGTVSKK